MQGHGQEPVQGVGSTQVGGPGNSGMQSRPGFLVLDFGEEGGLG